MYTRLDILTAFYCIYGSHLISLALQMVSGAQCARLRPQNNNERASSSKRTNERTKRSPLEITSEVHWNDGERRTVAGNCMAVAVARRIIDEAASSQ